MDRFVTAALVLGLIVAASASSARADAYPSKPIRLIVPSAPGSPPDIRARWLAEKLRISLGQPIVVDNRPGAAGMIGTELAARSPADGYTLALVHQGTLALNPHLYPNLTYDPVKDFAPISRLVVSAMMLAVHPSVPANSVADLIRLAKEKPGQINFGSAGTGSPPHMAAELFRNMAHIDVWHIPYKSAPAAQMDLLAGRVAYTVDGIALQGPQVRAGKLRALGVSSARRVPAFPDVPTIAEAGVPGYEYLAWMGVSAPAGTPREIVVRLNAEITKIQSTPEARAWFEAQGGEVITETPEQFDAYIKTEIARWGKVIREAGIKVETE